MALEIPTRGIVFGRMEQTCLDLDLVRLFLRLLFDKLLHLVDLWKKKRETKRKKERQREREGVRERPAFIDEVTDRVAHFVAAKRQASNLFATPTNLFLDFFV